VTRDSVDAKARRLLTEGRVTILRASPQEFAAQVRGDHAGLYACGYSGGRWYCACPHSARTTFCSHQLALMLLWIEPEAKP
jgi:uncharacterized Zn finger protein